MRTFGLPLAAGDRCVQEEDNRETTSSHSFTRASGPEDRLQMSRLDRVAAYSTPNALAALILHQYAARSALRSLDQRRRTLSFSREVDMRFSTKEIVYYRGTYPWSVR